MIYIVTGRHRSGTSMLVRCLNHASRNQLIFDSNLEELIKSRALDPSYNPNPNGYFQSEMSKLSEIPDNAIIKVGVFFWYQQTELPPPNALIIRMIRDEEERQKSFKRAFGGEFLNPYVLGEEALEKLNVKLLTINYNDVVVEPKKEFLKIKEFGFDIDVDQAVSLVDPTLYRNKKQE